MTKKERHITALVITLCFIVLFIFTAIIIEAMIQLIKNYVLPIIIYIANIVGIDAFVLGLLFLITVSIIYIFVYNNIDSEEE